MVEYALALQLSQPMAVQPEMALLFTPVLLLLYTPPSTIFGQLARSSASTLKAVFWRAFLRIFPSVTVFPKRVSAYPAEVQFVSGV